MVLKHVAQRAGAFVVCRAMLDADSLRGRDLHVVDVAAVPDRLEHAVAEAKDQEVLDGLLPEIVIDPVDLLFIEMLVRQAIEGARAVKIGSERLFDDDAPPPTRRRIGEPGRSQLLDDSRIDGGRNREIVEDAFGAVDLRQTRLQALVQLRIVGFASEVIHPARKGFGDLIFTVAGAGKLLQTLPELRPERLVVHLAARRCR